MAKTPAPEAPQPEQPIVGKGRATPSRADQVAARKRPLVPDTKEAKAAARARLASQRERARLGMAAGEEKYLMARDKGPQRRFIRNWVDTGWRFGETIMPVIALGLFASFVPQLALYAYALLWLFVLLVIIDMVVVSLRAKAAARKEFGADRIEKGLGWYAAMRVIQMRFLRTPKPQVTRRGVPIGEEPRRARG